MRNMFYRTQSHTSVRKHERSHTFMDMWEFTRVCVRMFVRDRMPTFTCKVAQ